MAQVPMAVRRRMLLGLLVAGVVLVVLGAVLAAVGGTPAVTGVAGGGAAVALLALLSISQGQPITLGTLRLIAAQPVVLAAAVTGTAVAVGSPAGGAARLLGGALAAIAVAVDCLMITFWWQDRPGRRQP